MKRLYILYFLIFALLSSTQLIYAQEPVLTINDYYGKSKNQLLVIPTLNQSENELNRTNEQSLKLKKFLDQFGPVKILNDKEFSPSMAKDNTVIIFGTEKTNSVLKKYSKSIPLVSSPNGIKFYNRIYKGKDISAIFVNQIENQNCLIFYMPDLSFLQNAFDISHGGTSFLIFSNLSYKSQTPSIAMGNFQSKDGAWEINPYSLVEGQPSDSELIVLGCQEENGFNVGDIIKEINGKTVLLSTVNEILENLVPAKTYDCIVSRGNQDITIPINASTSKTLSFGFIPTETTPIKSVLFKKEAERVIYVFKKAYIDPFNYLKSEKFKKECQELLDTNAKSELSILEVIKKLSKFAASFNDGHVYLSFNKFIPFLWENYKRNNTLLFPFQPFLKGGKFFVPPNQFEIPVGAEIIGINNTPIAKILKKLSLFAPGETFENKLTDFAKKDFYHYFYLAYGSKETFKLTLDCSGNKKILEVPGVAFYDLENNCPQNSESIWTMINDKLMYFSLGSFSFNDDLENGISDLFSELVEKKVPALIIDIRENGGGSTSSLNFLTEKLTSQPYKVYNMCRSKKSRYAEAQGAGFDQDMAYGQTRSYTIDNFSQAEETEGIYSGRVYVLTGAQTFSTAFDFASVMKNLKRAKIIGLPAGGRMIQTGDHFQLQVFNRFTLSVPYKDFLPALPELKNYSTKKGKSLLKPDVLVEYTSLAASNNIDPCIEIIEKLEANLKSSEKFEALHRENSN